MSAITGCYRLDGRPVDLDLLKRMTAVLAHRGPDGVGCWHDGAVGLGHRMLHTTPETLRETQPLMDETGNLCLVLDGRVDNRDALLVALEAKGLHLRTDTDAELVLRAYECWGEACPAHIIGDFAFALWDGRKRQLFCARDILGLKPFYYHTDGKAFRWASEPHALFEDPTVPKEPNEGMIGEYLAAAITHKEETLYRGIYRLPPAHVLIVRPGRLLKSSYWDIDPVKEIRYRTDAEYAEHFRELFREAVRCRLRSNGPVGAYLSGGLDSSSVVGMVQTLYREGIVLDNGFETFSLVFPGLSCDESAYIRDVVRMWGIDSNVVSATPLGASYFAEQVRRYHDLPAYPNGASVDRLNALARDKGFRVLLGGEGGDDWLTGNFSHYADFLRNGRLLTLLIQLCCDIRRYGSARMVFPSTLLLRVGVWPLMSTAVRDRLRRVLKHRKVPRWIDRRFADRIGLSERLRTKGEGRRYSSVAQQYLYEDATAGWTIHLNEVAERSSAFLAIEQRHPFYDRRVVEFAVAIPEEQRWRRVQSRFLLRQAMGGVLPERIRQRVSKAEFSPLFVESLRDANSGHSFDSLGIASLDWLDGACVQKMYQVMQESSARGDECPMHTWPLWIIFGLDLWVKLVFLHRETFSPSQLVPRAC